MNESLATLVFALGGGLGAGLRHGLGQLVAHRLPIATLLVNVLGSLILGAALGAIDGPHGGLEPGAHRLVSGFCGGFTTFSSFAVQSLALRRTHSTAHLLANVAANLGLCLAAFLLGGALGAAGFGA